MNREIQAFLDSVCDQVRCREVHDEIRLELGGYLQECMDRRDRDGLSESEAVKRALADMGSPILIGQQLNKTHKPSNDWGLVGATPAAQ